MGSARRDTYICSALTAATQHARMLVISSLCGCGHVIVRERGCESVCAREGERKRVRVRGREGERRDGAREEGGWEMG